MFRERKPIRGFSTRATLCGAVEFPNVFVGSIECLTGSARSPLRTPRQPALLASACSHLAAGVGKSSCERCNRHYLSRLMPKSVARSKTRKAVAKRFKITARGKVLRAQSSRRHLLSAKNAKRKRQLGKAARVDNTDIARIKANLPFG